jgi:2-polyprenyl-6-hydroxyphenyl methylase/3-demethylubiquinone-9 3-methyltransferase
MTDQPATRDEPDRATRPFDTSSHKEFFEYYAAESASEAALVRFRTLRDLLLAVLGRGKAARGLDVLDIGCGAGTFSILWAESGQRVAGVDINEPLLELGRKRAAAAGHGIDFRVGSATALPFPDASFDICCMPELLEHVEDWERCIDEATRVVRPGGLLYVTTTNRLCPQQEEFNLPLYSWYPKALQRRYVRLASTTRPELANYAKYPAYHWFTYYGLRRVLERRGFRCLDRFDLATYHRSGGMTGLALTLIRTMPGLRFLGQIATPGTRIAGIKERETVS